MYQEHIRMKGHAEPASLDVAEETHTTSQAAAQLPKSIPLKLCQLRILHAMRFTSAQVETYPGMTVTIDTVKREVAFKGKTSDIQAAEDAMYHIIHKMKDEYFERSVHLVKLMRGITMIRHTVNMFKSKGICAVYAATGETTLGVFAIHAKHVKRAICVIKRGTDEELVDADSEHTLQTPQWAALKEQLHSQHKGLLAITESGTHITVSGTVDAVAQVKEKMQRFLAKHCHDSNSVLLRGTTVQVAQGDLTTFPADAIVSAANKHLRHTAGLAKAIVDAGGRVIQQECDKYIRQHGSLKPGDVYVSESGRLPCKNVIHAVGPRWLDGSQNEEKDLRHAVYESMMAAEQRGLSSIALPALSGGIFGYPLDKCTKTIVLAVKDFVDGRKYTSVKNVSLVDPADRVVDAFHKSLDAVFGLQRTEVSDRGGHAKAIVDADEASSQNNVDNDTSIQTGQQQKEIEQENLPNKQRAPTVKKRDKRSSHSARHTSELDKDVPPKRPSSASAKCSRETTEELKHPIKTAWAEPTSDRKDDVVESSSQHSSLADVNSTHSVNATRSKTLTCVVKMAAPQATCTTPRSSGQIAIEQEDQGAIGGAIGHTRVDNDTSGQTGPLRNDVVPGVRTTERTDVIGNCTTILTPERVKYPKCWSKMGVDEPYIVVKLDDKSGEYKKVQKTFIEDGGKSEKEISTIERVQNPRLYQQYMLRKEEIMKHCGQQKTIRRTLWYNARRGDVADINANGFRGSANEANPFGDGICFTEKHSAGKHPKHKKKKRVYQARVITGYAVNSEGYAEVRGNQGAHGRAFDSVFDSATKTHVVFSSDQAYPEHLITFR